MGESSPYNMTVTVVTGSLSTCLGCSFQSSMQKTQNTNHDSETIEHVAQLFEEHGSTIWQREAKDLCQKDLRILVHRNGEFNKRNRYHGRLVWPVSWNGAKHRPELKYPADLYLKVQTNTVVGSTHLLSHLWPTMVSHHTNKSCLKVSPWMEGRGKMSKSLGNTIARDAESLRWNYVSATSVDSVMTSGISMDLWAKCSEIWPARSGNTLRFFLIANTSDF